MSAIAGILNLNGAPVSIEHSSGMMKALEKFPANDIQTWHKDNLFLGCHAQWITPESISEQLPFYDYARGLAITADAIIDNREELFQLLQIDREDQKKITDSQLILLAYHKWGEDSPKYLVGDFAYVIWDEKEQKLFGARDFSGSRTLYYFQDGQRFVFCTVMKPILQQPYVNKGLNEGWIAEYLANPFMYESVDPNITVFQKLLQLPPSHSITLQKKNIKLSRYSFLTSDKKLMLRRDEEYIEAFKEIFSSAVSSKLRTYKKVGAHLSGGLDSGTVVSFAEKKIEESRKELYSFSYVPVEEFNGWNHRSRIANERPLIEKTVNHIGNINNKFLSFPDRNSYTEINEWLDILEMPYKYFENTYWLRGIYEEAGKQDIGVLLTGQRGNWSISWGPRYDYYSLLFKKLKWIKLYKEINQYNNLSAIGKRRILTVLRKKLQSSLFKNQNNTNDFPAFINESFSKKTNVNEILKVNGVDVSGNFNNDIYQLRKEHFQNVFIWNTTGNNATKLSLRYGLVARDPTNDLRVVRFCLSIPEEQYVKEGFDRALIRRATKDMLPDDIRLNMKVRGVQGADGIHRMIPCWDNFLNEIIEMQKDELMSRYINHNTIKNAYLVVKEKRSMDMIFGFEFKVLMRSIILSRFLKSLTW